MKYTENILKNGLRFITIPMPSLESATVTVWVKTGSRNETDDIAGISHFLEHIVFKGSKKRPSAKQISEAVDSFGGEFNAATFKDWTNFYIKSRSDSLEKAFDVLSDMVLNPLLKEQDIQREKGVIIEEMAMYEDTPMLKITDIFERSIFKNHNLGRDIIGFKESVKSVDEKKFKDYRKKYYFGENMLLSVAGGVNQKEVEKLARKYFNNLSSRKKNVELVDLFTQSQVFPRVTLQNKKIERAHLVLGFLGQKRNDKRRFTEAVLTSILGGGMSSRMFTEVREKRGLAYSVKVYTDHFEDTGMFATYAGVAIKKAQEAIKVMMDQYLGLASRKLQIKPSELKKAKEYIKGQLALSLEDTKNVSSFFGIKALFALSLETPEQVFKKIDAVTANEVYALAREYFVSQKLNLAVIGPFKDQKPFEKLLQSNI